MQILSAKTNFAGATTGKRQLLERCTKKFQLSLKYVAGSTSVKRTGFEKTETILSSNSELSRLFGNLEASTTRRLTQI